MCKRLFYTLLAVIIFLNNLQFLYSLSPRFLDIPITKILHRRLLHEPTRVNLIDKSWE